MLNIVYKMMNYMNQKSKKIKNIILNFKSLKINFIHLKMMKIFMIDQIKN